MDRIITAAAAMLLAALDPLAAQTTQPTTATDFNDHRCYWSPPNLQEQGGYGGPWQCNETVGVAGNRMTFNGQPWRSRGVTLQAFVRRHDTCPRPEICNAYNAYGPQELQAIHTFGADTIRFQVSQPSLDPQSSLYSQDYVNALVAGLKQARQAGFVVMIMMQDEPISGSKVQAPLATAETQRDWDFLNSIFAQDRGVLYELYNEPRLLASRANWGLWKNGDSAGADPSVGMQTMITRLRGEGSQNVFVLDALEAQTNGVTEAAATLEGLPSIADPLARVVYAVHPYPHGMPATPGLWDVRFGNASWRLPVDADEWSAQGGAALGLGDLPTYDVAVQFLDYVRLHPAMSLGAGAFDIPGFMTQNLTSWTPTNYDGYSKNAASKAQNDAGLLVQALYQTSYWRHLTCADGVTQGGSGRCTLGR